MTKLDKPPYAHNWVRYVYPDQDKTTKALVSFARGVPTTTYSAAVPIIHDRITMRLDLQTALQAAATKGRANSRGIVSEYVEAFYAYDNSRRYSGLPSFDQMVEPFRIGKGVDIPVKPLITIVEHDNLVPIFSVGWATFPLTKWQMRLLATVFEDAVFSLTDFRSSSGEFLCFPKIGKGDEAVRTPLVWKRGDIDLLSKAELRDAMDGYLAALETAKAIVAEDRVERQTPPQKPASAPDERQGKLDF